MIISIKKALVVGAGSGIAGAIVKRLLDTGMATEVVAISRQDPGSEALANNPRVKWIKCDYQEQSITDACNYLKESGDYYRYVFICNGLLHAEGIFPEKRLEDLSEPALEEVFRVNTFIPSLWLKHLLPVLKGNKPVKMVVFSARVGSISDNRLGGWYSYRASKAALNMIVKTASIEYARRAANVALLLFHPGTTDTGLSRPFQANVQEGKLFQPEFVASQLLDMVLPDSDAEGLRYLDWSGETIPW